MSRLDRYPELGPKLTAATEMEAMTMVRAVWSQAYKEGSTGYERTWWVGKELVAHQWPKSARAPEPLWIRIRGQHAF